jgi:uracil-DNA glycosylase
MQELVLLRRVEVVIALGKIAFDSFLKAHCDNGGTIPKPRPKFGHGASVKLDGGLTLIASYHPSQQNTFTGKLTREMFHAIFDRVRRVLQDR